MAIRTISGSFTRPAGASQTLYCLLEARSGYTPAESEIFTIEFDTSDLV